MLIQNLRIRGTFHGIGGNFHGISRFKISGSVELSMGSVETSMGYPDSRSPDPWNFPWDRWKLPWDIQIQDLRIRGTFHGIGGNFHGISRFQDLGKNRQFLPIFYHAIWGWLGCMAGLNTCNCILPGFCTELSEVENKWNICWNGLCSVSFFVERLFKMGQ